MTERPIATSTTRTSVVGPRARFTLTIAASRDGFIARARDDAPQNWASAEEQALFFADVERADWAVMGRNTHLAADRPDRRRIVFSTTVSGWQRPSQLWLDPSEATPAELVNRVSANHPLENGLILGGTQVHDWFHERGAIDRVHLTVEPVEFGQGLPIFSDQSDNDALAAFEARGYKQISDTALNDTGTRYLILVPSHG